MPGGLAGLKQVVRDFHRARRARLPADHAVGQRHARPGQRDWDAVADAGRASWAPTASTATPTTACRAPSMMPPTRPAARWCSSRKARSPPTNADVEPPDLGQGFHRLRPRRQQVQVARTAPHGQHREPLGRDRTDDLQYVFFNGVGYNAGKTSGASGTSSPPRCRSAAPDRHHRAPVPAAAGQPGLAAVRAGAAAGRVRQHLPARRA